MGITRKRLRKMRCLGRVGIYDVARDIADIRRVIGRLVCDDLGTIRKSRGVTLDRVWSRERDVDDGFVERDE